MKRTELKRKPVAQKPPKPKKCSECPTQFVPWNSTQLVCSGDCGLARIRRVEAKRLEAHKKAERRAVKADLRRRKEALKSKSDWMKEAQKAFNWFIRERDWDQPCISCDKPATHKRRNLSLTGGFFDCGHYRSIGSMVTLRFEELNAHKQCKQCNRDLSGNVVEYRIRLKERIGEEKLDWLEGPHPAKNYTIEDYKQIKKHYNAEARALKKAREEKERFNAA